MKMRRPQNKHHLSFLNGSGSEAHCYADVVPHSLKIEPPPVPAEIHLQKPLFG